MTSTPASAASALKSPAFRRLTAGWVLTNLADSLLMLLMAVWVKDLTGSNVAAGLTFALFGVPALFAPLLGHLADRMSRLRMMWITYVVGAAALLPLLAVRGAGDVWLVYAVTTVYATIGYSTAAAQSGVLRDLLPDDALGPANGRLTTIDHLMRVALPVVGAGVYATTGMLPLILTAVIGFLGAAAVIATIRLQETPPAPDEERGRLRDELAAGFTHLAHTPPLGRQSIALTIAFGATGLLNAVAFAIIDALGLPPESLGPLVVGQGLAGALGGMLAPRLAKRWGRPRTIGLGLSLLGVGMVPLTSQVIWLGALGMTIVGFGIATAVVAYVTERQLRTPATLQGRVSAATNVLLNLPSVVLTVAGAALLGLVDYRVLIVVTVVACLACVPLVLTGGNVAPAPGESETSDSLEVAETASDAAGLAADPS